MPAESGTAPAYESVGSIGGQCPEHYQPLGTCCRPVVRYTGVSGQDTVTRSDGRPAAQFAFHPSALLRARDELRRRAKSARATARADTEHASPNAAALRGKAKGYQEAADLIELLMRGGDVRSTQATRRGRRDG